MKISKYISPLLPVLLLAGPVLALPDDRNQTGVGKGPLGIDTRQQDGVTTLVYKGSMEEPAEFIQGSLRLSGTEITVVRSQRELLSVSADGMPVRFQQQPEPDGPLVHASGSGMLFDNTSQELTINEGELAYDGVEITSCLIHWQLETRSSSASPCSDGSNRPQTVLPPNRE